MRARMAPAVCPLAAEPRTMRTVAGHRS